MPIAILNLVLILLLNTGSICRYIEYNWSSECTLLVHGAVSKVAGTATEGVQNTSGNSHIRPRARSGPPVTQSQLAISFGFVKVLRTTLLCTFHVE